MRLTREQVWAFTQEELRNKHNETVNAITSLLSELDGDGDIDDIEARAKDLTQDLALLEERIRDLESQASRAANVRTMLRGARTLEGGTNQPASADQRMQYRQAFMEFVCSGTPIPAELRQNQNTKTSDLQAGIPTELINTIIEKMDDCGMILPLMTRTSYAAGVVIPTSSVKPVASWVAEGATSDRQKKATGKVTFTYNKLRCEISMSMEVSVMAIDAFERVFTENVANAMVKAIEQAYFTGSGSGRPKGILTETAPTGQTFTLTGTEPTYAELVAIEAAVPAEYESTAKWFMSKKQFMDFYGMVDNNKQPIARVNYGLAGKPERVLLGREVIVHPYDMGDFLACIFDPADYVLNTVYDLGIQRKEDWDTEDQLTKAVMSVDGKAVSADSLITLAPKSN